ncbi:hypothetical protein D3C86_1229090 [compost metagenome]
MGYDYIQGAVQNAEAEAAAKKIARALRVTGGYVQLPSTDKALLVENCATDGDPSPQLLAQLCIHLRL